MSVFDDTITGLGNTIKEIQKRDADIISRTEVITGTPIRSSVASGTIQNPKVIIWQVKGIAQSLNVPDLIMKINPSNLDESYTQLINRKRSLGGFIEEHWGEQLDSLSASGTTRSFFGPNGLTNQNRRDTEGYKEFEQLVNIYRNNGSIYNERTGQIVAQGTIVMNYDDYIYQGYFETFSIKEVNNRPYNLDYDFTFKVTYEEYPGRVKSFKNITTVLSPGSPSNRVTLNIL